MKTILIPIEDHDAMASVLDSARLVAQMFGQLRPKASRCTRPPPTLCRSIRSSSLTMPHIHEHDAETEHDAHALFDAFMAAHNIPAPAPPRPARLSHGWVQPAPEADPFIGTYGRLFDLIVLGRPGRGAHAPPMAPLETALFESGRPVLVAPPVAPRNSAAIFSWPGTATPNRRAPMRTLCRCFASPRRSRSYRRRRHVAGPDRRRGRRSTGSNGLPPTAFTVAPGGADTGNALLDHGPSTRLRSSRQRRLYAKPAAADDLRRHHAAHSCQCRAAGADGPLMAAGAGGIALHPPGRDCQGGETTRFRIAAVAPSVVAHRAKNNGIKNGWLAKTGEPRQSRGPKHHATTVMGERQCV